LVPLGLFRNRFGQLLHQSRMVGHDFLTGYAGGYGAYNAPTLRMMERAQEFSGAWRSSGFLNALPKLRLNTLHSEIIGDIRGGFDAAAKVGSVGGWSGFAAGIGAPMIAGSIAFSGLANIFRGRYGRGLLQLMGGAALTYGLYSAYNKTNAYLSNTTDPAIPRNNYDIPAFLRRGTKAQVQQTLGAVHAAQGGAATAESHVMPTGSSDPEVARVSLFAFKRFI